MEAKRTSFMPLLIASAYSVKIWERSSGEKLIEAGGIAELAACVAGGVVHGAWVWVGIVSVRETAIEASSGMVFERTDLLLRAVWILRWCSAHLQLEWTPYYGKLRCYETRLRAHLCA